MIQLFKWFGFVGDDMRYREIKGTGIKIIDPTIWNATLGTFYFLFLLIMFAMVTIMTTLINKCY